MPPPGQQIKVITDHYFVVSIPGVIVGAFNECRGLSMEFDVFEWAEGGNNEFVHHLPGRLRYPYLSFNSGLTDSKALQEWFWKTRTQAELKEVTIEIASQDGETQRAWTFADAYPIKWSGPTIAAHGSGVANESLDIAHSGLKMS
jgi:phage tail-like protein